jgi:hypothetical protein
MDIDALQAAGIRVRQYTDTEVVEHEPLIRPNRQERPRPVAGLRRAGFTLVPTKQLDPNGYPAPVENWRAHMAPFFPDGYELTHGDWIAHAGNNFLALDLARSGLAVLRFTVDRMRSRDWKTLAAGRELPQTPVLALDTEAENRKTRGYLLNRPEVFDEIHLFKASPSLTANVDLCPGVQLVADGLVPLPGTPGPLRCEVRWMTGLRPWPREEIEVSHSFNTRTRTFGGSRVVTVNDLAELPEWLIPAKKGKR